MLQTDRLPVEVFEFEEKPASRSKFDGSNRAIPRRSDSSDRFFCCCPQRKAELLKRRGFSSDKLADRDRSHRSSKRYPEAPWLEVSWPDLTLMRLGRPSAGGQAALGTGFESLWRQGAEEQVVYDDRHF